LISKKVFSKVFSKNKEGGTLRDKNITKKGSPREAKEPRKVEARKFGKKSISEGRLFEVLLEKVPYNIYFKDKESRFVAVSKSQVDWSNVESMHDLLGKTDFDFYNADEAKILYEEERKIMATGEPMINKEEKYTNPDGEEGWVTTTKFPLYDEKGEVIGIFGISSDITRRKLLELEKERKIESQREELIDLSTPVIDVWEGILTVPIMGVLDSERASRISEALLTQIVEKNANSAIIDISGISSVDSAVADLLIRTAKAVKLVGAEAILTGVGVEIAQTIADLGIDMKGLKTMSTLGVGLKYVINRGRKLRKNRN
jgi:rsbT co-antagonist protein RsbR